MKILRRLCCHSGPSPSPAPARLPASALPCSVSILFILSTLPLLPSAPSAADGLARVERPERAEALFGEARRAYEELERGERLDVLTQSQADARHRAWQDYLDRYASTGHRVAEAREKARASRDWRPGFPRNPGHRDKHSLDLGGGVAMEMVYLRGGSFRMGSNEGDSDEKPVHTVELDGFWMGETEVTQAQYETVMGTNPSHFKGRNLPVEWVLWNDAKDFCDRLSRKTGQAIRLPTEAEWEYACRAGSDDEYCFGDSDSGLGAYAWYDGNSGRQTHPVGRKRANRWGLHDMHGNVWEWCEDWYGDYENASRTNPSGPLSGSLRVSRGGSWINVAGNCRSATRDRLVPSFPSYDLGFRVAAPLEP